jgi:hypothetical protein
MVLMSRRIDLNRSATKTVFVAGLLLSAAAIMVIADAAPVPRSATPLVYQPSLGDLMTMTVQPRHIKLALAGRERNWSYAAYELQQLEEAFERVSRQWPQWKTVPISDMVTGVTQEPLAALSRAIKAADANRFAAAYKQLTDGCNLCHQGANVGVNVIRVPEASPFPNQDFRPVK